jgi:hypothetical protein
MLVRMDRVFLGFRSSLRNLPSRHNWSFWTGRRTRSFSSKPIKVNCDARVLMFPLQQGNSSEVNFTSLLSSGDYS